MTRVHLLVIMTMNEQMATHTLVLLLAAPMLRYKSTMTAVASITFSRYHLFFLGLSYHHFARTTKDRDKGSNRMDHKNDCGDFDRLFEEFDPIGGCYDVAVVKLPFYKGQEISPLYVTIRIWALAYRVFAICGPKAEGGVKPRLLSCLFFSRWQLSNGGLSHAKSC